jgi:transcriptional regulator with XRE-family HTH domain
MIHSGTPHFIGARLLEAREIQGLTQAALGEKLGVSAQAISQYEKGLSTPQPHVMERLPDVLNVQPAYFFTSREDQDEAILFFRSMARAATTGRTRAKHKYHR